MDSQTFPKGLSVPLQWSETPWRNYKGGRQTSGPPVAGESVYGASTGQKITYGQTLQENTSMETERITGHV